jgi:hypothetical protein
MNIKEAIESLTDLQLEAFMEFTMITEEVDDVNTAAAMIVTALHNMSFNEYHVRAIAQKMMLDMTSGSDVVDVEVS